MKIEGGPPTIPRHHKSFNDFGGFDDKGFLQTWDFWIKDKNRQYRPLLDFPIIIISEKSWYLAREKASLEFALRGIYVAPQDLESKPTICLKIRELAGEFRLPMKGKV